MRRREEGWRWEKGGGVEGGEDGKEGMRMRSQNKRQRGVGRWRVQVVELEAEVHFTLLCSSAAARGSTLALAKPRARTSAGLGQSATLIALQREQRDDTPLSFFITSDQ